jgi:fused signal recognition particle receptor
MADILSIWKTGLTKTSKAAFGRLSSLIGTSEITSDTWDELEALLLQSDLGVKATSKIITQLQATVASEGITRDDEFRVALRSILLQILTISSVLPEDLPNPAIILMVGVNGSGKTTTIGKLGKKFKDQGKKVVFGAGDTFRAAASEQLEAWGKRNNIEVIKGAPDSDSGAVAYNTVQHGLQKGAEVILIDTAGRLHTRFNLMEELKKVHRVIAKTMEGAPHRVYLVLDATTGQNAIQQAKNFKEAVAVNGVILTKLDSSAKGGVVFSIVEDLQLPIVYVGLGEKEEDLISFDPESFINSLIN